MLNCICKRQQINPSRLLQVVHCGFKMFLEEVVPYTSEPCHGNASLGSDFDLCFHLILVALKSVMTSKNKGRK